jgi:hypothetical protein
VRKLGFEESPDYDFLRELFNKVLRRMGESDDGIYDWMLLGGKGGLLEVETNQMIFFFFFFTHILILSIRLVKVDAKLVKNNLK